MKLYWQEVRRGQRLVMGDGDQEQEVGGVRLNKDVYDAFAKTFGYDPGRAARSTPWAMSSTSPPTSSTAALLRSTTSRNGPEAP